MSRPVLADSGSSHLTLATLRPTRYAPAPLPPELLTSSCRWLYHHHPGLARLACSHVTHLPHPPQEHPAPATTDAIPSRRQEEREEPRSRAKTYASSRENKVRLPPEGEGRGYLVAVGLEAAACGSVLQRLCLQPLPLPHTPGLRLQRTTHHARLPRANEEVEGQRPAGGRRER